MVDGFDELKPENQEKIKFALENGHIPDEDWKGVRCLSFLPIPTVVIFSMPYPWAVGLAIFQLNYLCTTDYCRTKR